MEFSDFLLNQIKDNSTLEIDKWKIINQKKDSLDQEITFKRKENRYSKELYYALWRTADSLNKRVRDKDFRHKYLINFGEEFEFAEDLFFMEMVGNGFDGCCRIRTGNLVGQIKIRCDQNPFVNNFTVQINSRFGISFLAYLIASSEGFLELEREGAISHDGMAKWLLIYLWKIKLLSAHATVGLPKFYRSFSDDLSVIRGNLRIGEYARKTYESGKYPCTYRQHSFNNLVSQTVNMTFERLMRSESSYPFLDSCARLRQVFLNICGGERISVRKLLKDLHQMRIANPFFLRYKEVVKISKMILRQEYADLWPEDDEFSGFLFDISMLFEHHIRKLMIRAGLSVEPKTQSKSAETIPTGTYDRPLCPDIIVRSPRGTWILDVKYKRWNAELGVSREDLFQIVTYASVYAKKYRDVVGCGFIFPIAEGQKQPEEKTLRAFQDLKFRVFFYEIPPDLAGTSGQNNFGTPSASFLNRMADSDRSLIEAINNAVGFAN